MVRTVWEKLNANERLVSLGAIVVLGSWLVAVATGGGFGASWSFLLAAAVLVVYWLKYSGNQQVNWPMPVPTMILVGSAVGALFALLALLTIFSWLGALGIFGGFFMGYLIAIIGNAVGSAMMALGAWREYQAMPKSAPPSA